MGHFCTSHMRTGVADYNCFLFTGTTIVNCCRQSYSVDHLDYVRSRARTYPIA
jgi:hypothetical protein